MFLAFISAVGWQLTRPESCRFRDAEAHARVCSAVVVAALSRREGGTVTLPASSPTVRRCRILCLMVNVPLSFSSETMKSSKLLWGYTRCCQRAYISSSR